MLHLNLHFLSTCSITLLFTTFVTSKVLWKSIYVVRAITDISCTLRAIFFSDQYFTLYQSFSGEKVYLMHSSERNKLSLNITG